MKKEKKHPDRPIECTECKRPIAIHYKEMAEGKCSVTGMCPVCPQLYRRMHGSQEETASATFIKGKGGLVCGDCGTTLESVRIGTPLGCSTCYEIFKDVVKSELLTTKSLLQKIAPTKKGTPLHVGRQPGETQEISPSLRLIALNEALEETLKQEDYEQAAWLRDQIKEITDIPENNDE